MTFTLTVRFDFFSQDTIRSQSRTVQLYVFLVIIWQQSFKGTHANVFRKIVCISLSIFSATAASHEIFHLLDGTHKLRQFHLRRRQNLPQETSCSSRCVRVHLPCSLRQLSKPWSLPADMTMSKLSPSVRADNTTKSCPSISAGRLNSEFRHSNCNCCCCDHVLRLCCKRQSARTFGKHTRHVVLDLFGPHVKMFFSA